MCRKTSFVFAILSLFAVSSVALAQDVTATPRRSVLLYEQAGDIFTWDTLTEKPTNLTADVDGYANSPMWGGPDDSFVVYEVEVGSDNESVVDAQIVEVATLEVIAIPRCQQDDINCLHPQMNASGKWVAVTALRREDGYPLLYVYDVETGETNLIQSGHFDTEAAGNRWIDENRFDLIGSFSSASSQVRRTFNIAEGGYTTSRDPTVLSQLYYGCNDEFAQPLFSNGTRNIFVSTLVGSSIEIIAAKLARGNPWHDCASLQQP